MDYLLGSPPLGTGVLFKLGFSGLLSLVIGIERELKRKPVGLKTSVVIATFSCLLTIISIETAYSTPARDDINITMDPLRLAAQIVSGIGFLGAGVILKRDNDNITGLTTAAMIWGAAGIGIAVGAGFYIEAAVAVAIVMIGVEFLPPLMNIVGPKRLRVKEYTLVTTITGMENIEQLIRCLREHSADPENVRMKMLNDEGFPENSHEVELRLSVQPKVNSSEIYGWLHELDYIQTAELTATQ
ncbi:MgtC/SapB family protein [Bhargavaea massiliensis]|uniref:MgtC/SapB family protein n=1 Tax=Bhargavaea massiliensis TaxID=2697500 RepID=UPI001BCEEF8B|nr:MgtC/SapB family protein [Bhargavaea massiliensis]